MVTIGWTKNKAQYIKGGRGGLGRDSGREGAWVEIQRFTKSLEEAVKQIPNMKQKGQTKILKFCTINTSLMSDMHNVV
jgi:hypothetical protein